MQNLVKKSLTASIAKSVERKIPRSSGAFERRNGEVDRYFSGPGNIDVSRVRKNGLGDTLTKINVSYTPGVSIDSVFLSEVIERPTFVDPVEGQLPPAQIQKFEGAPDELSTRQLGRVAWELWTVSLNI